MNMEKRRWETEEQMWAKENTVCAADADDVGLRVGTRMAGVSDLMHAIGGQKCQRNLRWDSVGTHLRVRASLIKLEHWIRKQYSQGISLDDDFWGVQTDDEFLFEASMQVRRIADNRKNQGR